MVAGGEVLTARWQPAHVPCQNWTQLKCQHTAAIEGPGVSLCQGWNLSVVYSAVWFNWHWHNASYHQLHPLTLQCSASDWCCSKSQLARTKFKSDWCIWYAVYTFPISQHKNHLAARCCWSFVHNPWPWNWPWRSVNICTAFGLWRYTPSRWTKQKSYPNQSHHSWAIFVTY